MSSDRNVCGILAKEFQSEGRDSTPGPVERMIRTFRKPSRLLRSVDKTKACVVCTKCLYKVVYSIQIVYFTKVL